MPQTNHYPLRSDLLLFQSDFADVTPHQTADQWRKRGWDAVEHRGTVRVLHASNDLPTLDEAQYSVPIARGDRRWGRAVGAVIAREFVRQHFLPRLGGGFMNPHHEEEERHSPIEGLKLTRHTNWNWDIEEDAGLSWLVPNLTWTKLTLEPAIDLAPWLSRLLPEQRWTLFNRRTGETHTHQDLQDVATLKLCEDRDVTVLIRPRAESRDWTSHLETLHHLIQGQRAFTQVAEVSALREVNILVPCHISEGSLVIKKTRIESRKQILKGPVHRFPDRQVELIVVLPESPSSRVLNDLTIQLRKESELKSRGLSFPKLRLQYIWRTTWGLKSYVLKVMYYGPGDSQLQKPETFQHTIDAALSEGRCPVLLAVAEKEHRMALKKQFQAAADDTPVIWTKDVTLSTHDAMSFSYRSRITSLVLTLLNAAGGVPWAIELMPGVGTHTLFLGLDLSHDHDGDRNVLAAVLVRPSGEMLTSCTFAFDQNNERIPRKWWTHELPNWLEEVAGPELPHLIVHRDGRFLEGEIDDLSIGLAHVAKLELIAVKKDSDVRIDGHQTGILLMGPSRALVIPTSSPSSRVAKPLELECHTEGDMAVFARQVLLLAHMRFDDLYGTIRLPITTHLAHRFAARSFEDLACDDETDW